MAALSGVIAGILGFAFARIFAEPVIDKAIAYESGRDDILAALNKAGGRVVAPDGPEIFSRTVQSTIGIATGIIAFSAASSHRGSAWSARWCCRPWRSWRCTGA